jgi:hypothetical protein
MKSDNRQGHRPEQTPAWDTLAGLSAAAGQLLHLPSILIPLLRDEKAMEAVEDKGRLQSLMKLIQQDVHQFSHTYSQLRQRHSHRSGEETDSNDLMDSIQVYQDYVEWSASFEELVMPNVTDLLELLRRAGADTSHIHLPRLDFT